MSKKLNTGDFDIDSGLDFAMEGDDAFGFEQGAKDTKSRSPIGRVTKGVLQGGYDTLKDRSFIRQTVRRSLPSSYGEITSALDEAAEGATRLYDDAVEELKPRTQRIAATIDKLVPENQKLLKKIIGKFKQKEGSEYIGPSPEEIQNQMIQSVTNEIFSKTSGLERERENRRDRFEKVSARQGAVSIQALNQMTSSLVRLEKYTTNVTQAFQRKSIELGIRSYLVQADMLKTMNKYFEAFRVQNEAIAKNTSLPDYAKLKNSERFMDMTKKKLFDGASRSLFGDGSAVKQGFKRLHKSGMNFVKGLGTRLDSAEFALDQVAMGKEQIEEFNQMLVEMGMEPMTREELLGSMLGSAAVNKAGDWVSGKLKGVTTKNPEITERLAKIAGQAKNIPGLATRLRRSDAMQEGMYSEDPKKAWLFNLADSILSNFQDTKETRSFNVGTSLESLNSEGMPFDKRAHLSLTEIIPGYLASINRELMISRTGNPNEPLMMFDFKANRFRSSKDISKSLTKGLISSARSSSMSYRTNDAVKNLMGDEKFNLKDERALKRFMFRLAHEGNTEYDSDSIHGTRAYEHLPEHLKSVVSTKLMTKLDMADDKEENKLKLTSSIRSLREAMPSLTDQIEEAINAGYGDELERSGFIKKTDTGYEVNEERFSKFLENSAVVRSDINIKKNIKPTSPLEILKNLRYCMFGQETSFGKKWNPKEAYRAIADTPQYTWNYQDGKGDDQTHSSPMAQDVRRRFGDKVAPGGKSIDLQSMNGALMSGISYLGSEVKNLKEGPTGQLGYLKIIANNTTSLVEMAKSGSVGMGAARASGGGIGSGDGYLDMLFNLGNKAVDDVKSAATRGYQYGRDKVASPIYDYLKKTYNDNKDPVKAKLSELFSKAMDLGGSALDTAKNFVTDTVPVNLRKAKDFIGVQLKKLKDWFNEVRDIYLPGGISPVITAGKLKAGFYYDQVTGAAVRTMDELMSAKGDIVDAAGNVILSLSDRVQGIYDRNGVKIKSTLAEIGATAMGAAVWLKDRMATNLGKLKDMGSSLLSKGKEKMKGFKNPFGGGSGVGSKETHDVIVDIRDILLGRKKDVLKRLKLQAKNLEKTALDGGGATTVVSTDGGSDDGLDPSQDDVRRSSGGLPSMNGIGDKLNELKKSVQNTVDKAKAATPGSDSFVGPVQPGAEKGGILGNLFGLKDKALKAKNAIPGTDGFMGPVQPGSAGGLLSRGLSKGKGLLGKAAGIGGGLLSGLSGLAGGALGMLGGTQNTADQGEAPEAPKEKGFKRLRKFFAQKDRAADDKDGDGIRDGSVEDVRKKQEELRESRKKDTLQADLRARYKSSENVIDKLMGMAGGLFGFLKNSAADVFDAATSLFKGGLVGKIFGSLGKGIGKVAGLGLKGIVRAPGAILRGGLALGRTGLSFAARTALTTIPAVTSMLGSAATAIAGFVTSPVVLTVGAVAGLGYLAYKGYKHKTRNDNDEFQRIRLKQYGFMASANMEQYNEYPYALENYLLDGRIGYNAAGTAYVLDRKVNIQEMLEMFNIDKDDADGATEWADWYQSRFKPFFLKHASALYAVNPKVDLTEIKKLTPEQKLSYLEKISFESGPYDLVTSPLKSIPAMGTDKEGIIREIKDLIKKIQDENPTKDEKKEGSKTDPKKAAAAAAATKALSRAKENALTQEEIKRKNEELKNRNASANGGVTAAGGLTDGDGERSKDQVGSGGGPGGAGSNKLAGAAPPSNLPMALGKLLDGSGGMEFIKLKKGVTIENLHPGVLKNFLAMAEEYGKATGKTINVNDAFRSYAEQKALFDKYPGKAARPGNSMHEFGLAIDVNSSDADEMERLGLMKKYGFTRPVGGEPWHMEPAGIQANLQAAKDSAGERDRLVEASLFRGGGGYGTVPGSVMRKRNDQLAKSLLGVPPKEVAKTEVEKTQNALNNIVTSPRIAANDPRGADPDPKEFASTRKNSPVFGTGGSSAAGGMGYGQVNAANTSAVNEGESKPSASSSSAKPSGDVEDLKSKIAESAKKAGVSPEMLQTFAALESDFKINSKSSAGASGAFGFMPETYREQYNKHAKTYGFSKMDPFDVEQSSILAGEYLKNSKRALSKVKPDPNTTDLYMAHFLGPSAANKFFLTDPNAVGVEVFKKAGAEPGNRSMFYAKDGRPLTLGEMYKVADNKVKKKSAHYGIETDTGIQGQASSALGSGELQKDFNFASVKKMFGGKEETPSSAKMPSGPTPAPTTSSLPVFNQTTSVNRVDNSRASSNIKFDTGEITSILEKSYDVQVKTLEVLKDLPTSLAKLMSAAQTSAGASQGESSVQKEKQLGRSSTERLGPQVLDTARRAM